MTSPADPPEGVGASGPRLRLLAVTACPTGIAHTYMAAEKLTQAAEAFGHRITVETQGSIGAENVLSDNDVRDADAIIIAADKDVDLSRFVGKRVLTVGVAEGVHHPEELIERARTAPVHGGDGGTSSAAEPGAGPVASAGRDGGGSGRGGSGRGVTYKALMNGVSYMIPFVVVGGLLIAVSLALGGHTTPEGIVIPHDSVWKSVNDIGVIGFQLMVPILSGYIAYAIADRPALVPGMVGGWIAAHGELYDSEAGAGFIGAIVTGFLAGYLVLWIKKVRVPRFVQPIMPIIVIPILSTSALGLFFVYVLGSPVSWVFEHLTDWLGGLTGTSAALLGVILGLMIAFDMGGPVNKTAFLFGAGLISKNPEVMGVCAAAIPVPPLGQGLATLLRRRLYSDQERETGLAALFMGFFGITEGAIPFAAAHPARVIPANMLGGAAAGAVAGLAAVEGSVPHGGPIVALLGAVGGVPMFFVAVAVGTGVTALTTVTLLSLGGGRRAGEGPRQRSEAGTARDTAVREPALAGVGAPRATAGDGDGDGDGGGGGVGLGGGSGSGAEADPGPSAAETEATVPGGGSQSESEAEPEAETEVLSGYLTARTVKKELVANARDAAIREMAELLAATGRVADVDELVRVAFAREAQGTTGLGEEIAIPHAKTDAVTAPVVGFARSAEGVEWESLDGTRARLVFMIAVPEAAAGDEHLRILALLSRGLMDPGFRGRLLEAADEAAILRVLGEIG
ncbi:fructose-specific PTS transporter subunit EIIC [Streptomyces sp. LX-29]|uniref:fructose-specific PTS transporter subunit EIIC n=1 Tax=Streptomyces sp. LX-29 TaxID=2900152 RepID=UPI00240E7348|nr:fructose-specific PTS transporter subunit EIIC [Streptomyces sp. LX-29]WFB09155.1 fructose-specific PTS transporter subunit EIIC [Streptomyces sp. LX-29]